jgi:hypothetical protein
VSDISSVSRATSRAAPPGSNLASQPSRTAPRGDDGKGAGDSRQSPARQRPAATAVDAKPAPPRPVGTESPRGAAGPPRKAPPDGAGQPRGPAPPRPASPTAADATSKPRRPASDAQPAAATAAGPEGSKRSVAPPPPRAADGGGAARPAAPPPTRAATGDAKTARAAPPAAAAPADGASPLRCAASRRDVGRLRHACVCVGAVPRA